MFRQAVAFTTWLIAEFMVVTVSMVSVWMLRTSPAICSVAWRVLPGQALFLVGHHREAAPRFTGGRCVHALALRARMWVRSAMLLMRLTTLLDFL
ncbi:MAG: hypothetical protein U1F68_15180 [Gammaproteobacteria bacterium]